MANTTSRTVFGVYETETFGYATFVCGFHIDLRTDATVEETDYSDNSGALVKAHFTNVDGPIVLTATNPANGKRVTSIGANSEDLIFANGEVVSDNLHGVIWNFRARPALARSCSGSGRSISSQATSTPETRGRSATISPTHKRPSRRFDCERAAAAAARSARVRDSCPPSTSVEDLWRDNER